MDIHETLNGPFVMGIKFEDGRPPIKRTFEDICAIERTADELLNLPTDGTEILARTPFRQVRGRWRKDDDPVETWVSESMLATVDFKIVVVRESDIPGPGQRTAQPDDARGEAATKKGAPTC